MKTLPADHVAHLNMFYAVPCLFKQLIELPTRFGAELGNE
jgi:hypothetical protein